MHTHIYNEMSTDVHTHIKTLFDNNNNNEMYR